MQPHSIDPDESEPVPSRSRGRSATLTFVGLSSALFAGSVAYTLVTKLADGDLAEDWAHTAIHASFAVTGLLVLWRSARRNLASVYAMAVLIVYGLLLWIGLRDGAVAEHTPMAVPLAITDNVFHAGLAGLAFVSLVLDSWRSGKAPVAKT